MALCGCHISKAESVLPNYWETISGIPPDSITWNGGLGLGNTSCTTEGSSKQVGVIVGARRGKGVGFSVTRV
jgi:hypothetical protein